MSKVTADQVCEIATYMHKNRDKIKHMNVNDAAEKVASETQISFGMKTFVALRDELGIEFASYRHSPISRGLSKFYQKQQEEADG